MNSLSLSSAAHDCRDKLTLAERPGQFASVVEFPSTMPAPDGATTIILIQSRRPDRVGKCVPVASCQACSVTGSIVAIPLAIYEALRQIEILPRVSVDRRPVRHVLRVVKRLPRERMNQPAKIEVRAWSLCAPGCGNFAGFPVVIEYPAMTTGGELPMVAERTIRCRARSKAHLLMQHDLLPRPFTLKAAPPAAGEGLFSFSTSKRGIA